MAVKDFSAEQDNLGVCDNLLLSAYRTIVTNIAKEKQGTVVRVYRKEELCSFAHSAKKKRRILKKSKKKK